MYAGKNIRWTQMRGHLSLNDWTSWLNNALPPNKISSSIWTVYRCFSLPSKVLFYLPFHYLSSAVIGCRHKTLKKGYADEGHTIEHAVTFFLASLQCGGSCLVLLVWTRFVSVTCTSRLERWSTFWNFLFYIVSLQRFASGFRFQSNLLTCLWMNW